jgi:hypothetical protein
VAYLWKGKISHEHRQYIKELLIKMLRNENLGSVTDSVFEAVVSGLNMEKPEREVLGGYGAIIVGMAYFIRQEHGDEVADAWRRVIREMIDMEAEVSADITAKPKERVSHWLASMR